MRFQVHRLILLNPPKGDAFAPSNKYAMQIDLEEQPPMFKVSDTHYAATWLLHPDAPKVEPPAAVKKRMNQISKQRRGNKWHEREKLLEIKNLKQYFNIGKPNDGESS